jgi:hypothetical protein
MAFLPPAIQYLVNQIPGGLRGFLDEHLGLNEL